MPNRRLLSVLAFTTMVFSELAEGPQPVLQRTVEALFVGAPRSEATGACRSLRASPQQTRMCRREPNLADALAEARDRAVSACRDAFRFDRWNCSALLNGKRRRSVFANVYRETALVHALVAASIVHTVARSCAAGRLRRCACAGAPPPRPEKAGRAWSRGGCGDDLAHGRRVAVDFLEVRRAGSDHIADVLRRDVSLGGRAVAAHAREACKCHGFSGSCTTKTCWRRVGPFAATMATLKREYQRAVRRRVPNSTARRGGGGRRRRRRLEYVQRGPDLCAGTRGRRCRDPDNCATLCCGRGYSTRRDAVAAGAAAAEEVAAAEAGATLAGEAAADARCACRMVGCCRVRCDLCPDQKEVYVCK